MKKLSIIIIATLIICYATDVRSEVSGYIFFGEYLSTNVQGLEGRRLDFKAGIYLETVKKDLTFFLKEETLLTGRSGVKFHPSQIGYTLGMKLKIRDYDVIYKHSCHHPIDGTGGGDKAISYDVVELRANF
jgi:hypothetical protein